MINRPWRTVVLNSYENLALKDNCLLISSEAVEQTVPIEQIKEILITSGKGSISIPLFTKLVTQDVAIIVCNEKYAPVCEVNGYGNHYERAGRQMDQASWSKRKKDAIWRQIVKLKISQQMSLLTKLGLTVPQQLKDCYLNVESGDPTNREAVASKLYFDVLFGKEFIRFESDDVNAALNYGYTILRSSFDRAIALHGYRSELGIHHHSRQNPFNLACDLMEPFRPFIDECVFKNLNRTFDWEYRKEIIKIPYNYCLFENIEMDISSAIEKFTYHVLETMMIPRGILEDIGFV